MKNKGFTIIEMLAVLCIIGLLIIIGVPAYMNVYIKTRRSNYHNRIKEVELAAEKYASAIKDTIKKDYDKDGKHACTRKAISDLIIAGYLPSDGADGEYITNPTTMQPMSGWVYLCYSYEDYDVKAYYAEEFNRLRSYYRGEKVYVSSGTVETIYNVKIDYDGSKTCKKGSGDSLHPMNNGEGVSIEDLQNCGRINQGTGEVEDVSRNFFEKVNT